MQLAEVRDLLQDVPRTIATYRRILTLDPNHAVTLNNLARNLSTHEQKHAEALKLIDRAIASANQNPDFHYTAIFATELCFQCFISTAVLSMLAFKQVNVWGLRLGCIVMPLSV